MLVTICCWAGMILSGAFVLTVIISWILAKFGRDNFFFEPQRKTYSVVICGKTKVALFRGLTYEEATAKCECLQGLPQVIKVVKE